MVVRFHIVCVRLLRKCERLLGNSFLVYVSDMRRHARGSAPALGTSAALDVVWAAYRHTFFSAFGGSAAKFSNPDVLVLGVRILCVGCQGQLLLPSPDGPAACAVVLIEELIVSCGEYWGT